MDIINTWYDFFSGPQASISPETDFYEAIYYKNQDKPNNKPVLHQIIDNEILTFSEISKTIRNLLSESQTITVDQIDQNGQTILHWVINHLCNQISVGHHPDINDYIEFIEYLLEEGINIDQQDKLGNTLFHFLAIRSDKRLFYYQTKNHKNLVIDLIGKGASLHTKNIDGNTPLHIAAAFGQAKMTEILLKQGADVNVENKEKNKPLHYAVMGEATEPSLYNHIQVAERLIDRGAILSCKNKNGDSPLDIISYLMRLKLDKNIKAQKMIKQKLLIQSPFLEQDSSLSINKKSIKIPQFSHFESISLPWLISPKLNHELTQTNSSFFDTRSITNWFNSKFNKS